MALCHAPKTDGGVRTWADLALYVPLRDGVENNVKIFNVLKKMGSTINHGGISPISHGDPWRTGSNKKQGQIWPGMGDLHDVPELHRYAGGLPQIWPGMGDLHDVPELHWYAGELLS